MTGDPPIRNLFHLITEFRVRCNAVTVNEVEEEEGRGWRTVAFPRVTDEQRQRDVPNRTVVGFFPSTGFTCAAAVFLLRCPQYIKSTTLERQCGTFQDYETRI